MDDSIGNIISALKTAGLYDNTLLIITAKHGGSPIDPTRYVANVPSTPATLLGTAIPFSESPLNPTGIGATEDDVSVLWLNTGASMIGAVTLLETNATAIGLGEIYYGPTLALNYNVGGLGPGQDPRSPDNIVTPNIGVTYSGSTTMIGDHGGFGHDDTNVILLVSNPSFTAQTYLGRDPNRAGSADDPEGAGAGSAGAGRGENRRDGGAATGWSAARKVAVSGAA